MAARIEQRLHFNISDVLFSAAKDIRTISRRARRVRDFNPAIDELLGKMDSLTAAPDTPPAR